MLDLILNELKNFKNLNKIEQDRINLAAYLLIISSNYYKLTKEERDTCLSGMDTNDYKQIFDLIKGKYSEQEWETYLHQKFIPAISKLTE